jgi:hypothetical protein
MSGAPDMDATAGSAPSSATATDAAADASDVAALSASRRPDHRGSPIPTGRMIATRFMELRKRRGLMIALTVVNIGIPATFLLVRLLLHVFAPHTYGPAGGYGIFTVLVVALMYTFGFLIAATLGCTAGSIDLTDGMFRHLVVTGRSRLALYLARIPAGLGIVVPIVGVGYAIVCVICVFSAPTTVSYQGVQLPAHLSRAGFENWAGDHVDQVVCNLPYNGPMPTVLPCGRRVGPAPASGAPTPAELKSLAIRIGKQDYTAYNDVFLAPSDSLMITAGLWLELEAGIGFVVGLGLASLIGQRTVPVILMIVLEIILTPIFATHLVPHLINVQRAVPGLAMAHIEPPALPVVFAGPGGAGGGLNGPALRSILVPETTKTAVIVICAWLVGWTLLGAWRMVKRDA